MRAARVHHFGPPEAIILEDVPVPAPGPGEVLIRVKAAGVGPWDGWIRAGKSALPQPLPLTLGSDLSGVVEAVGPGVSGLAPGDEAFGVTNAQFTDAYAEYAIAAAGMIAHKPSKLDHIAAASVPVIAVTAWQALFDEARLKARQSVLIHGGAGNVGAYAVQLARIAGLKVLATSGSRDIDYVKGLGADLVIDYATSRFEDAGKGVDAVIDLVGGETQVRSFDVLKPGGSLISAVSPPDQERAKRHGVTARFFLVGVTTDRLAALAGMIDAGQLATNVGSVLPLAAARTAHEMLEGVRPRQRGRIVLEVGI